MFLRIDTQDKRPIYQQIADGVRALLASGQLKEGQSLPPVRQLAADLGVNLNTIATAYRELQSEGLIVVRHGSGATVAARTATGHNPEELRGPLRNVLTTLVLAGMRRPQILRLVEDELQELMKGAES